MLGEKKPEFRRSGRMYCFKNILNNKGKLKWLLRDESINDVDNSWSFFSDIDDEFINNQRI